MKDASKPSSPFSFSSFLSGVHQNGRERPKNSETARGMWKRGRRRRREDVNAMFTLLLFALQLPLPQFLLKLRLPLPLLSHLAFYFLPRCPPTQPPDDHAEVPSCRAPSLPSAASEWHKIITACMAEPCMRHVCVFVAIGIPPPKGALIPYT
jgi:hypothetical protein